MKHPFIFSFLRVSTGFLYYSLIVITLVVIGKAALTFSGNTFKDDQPIFNYEAMGLNLKGAKPPTNFSADSLVRYTGISNRFQLAVEPNSSLGYFSFISTLLSLMIGIAIMWRFKRIFSEANLVEPFKQSIFRRLVSLSILFALADLVKIARYIVLNNLIERSISTPEFELATEVGNGFITGLIIYAIAIIYRRGLAIQEENALTV